MRVSHLQVIDHVRATHVTAIAVENLVVMFDLKDEMVDHAFGKVHLAIDKQSQRPVTTSQLRLEAALL